jgi:hypothetical protein
VAGPLSGSAAGPAAAPLNPPLSDGQRNWANENLQEAFQQGPNNNGINLQAHAAQGNNAGPVQPVINNNGINILVPAAQGNNAGPVQPINNPVIPGQIPGNPNPQVAGPAAATSSNSTGAGPVIGNNTITQTPAIDTATPAQLQVNTGSTAGPVASSSRNTTETSNANADNNPNSISPTEDTSDYD